MANRKNFKEYNEFVCFRAEYNNYKQAKNDGAVYKTGSTIDQLTVQSQTTTGFYDLAEILSVVEQCFGGGELVWGMIDKNDEFVAWEDAVFAINNT